MNRYLIICAMFLIGCDEKVRTIYAVPHVPDALRQTKKVVCPPGYEASDLAVCLLRKNAGLNQCYAQIGAIDEILTRAEAGAR